MAEEPDYLTPVQVAEKLQMNTRVVRRLLAAGKIPGKRVGGMWRTSAAALREFIESGEPVAQDQPPEPPTADQD